jgi:hypothetical protein
VRPNPSPQTSRPVCRGRGSCHFEISRGNMLYEGFTGHPIGIKMKANKLAEAFERLERERTFTIEQMKTRGVPFETALAAATAKFRLSATDQAALTETYLNSDDQYVLEVVPQADTPLKALKLLYDNSGYLGDSYYRSITDPVLAQVEKVLKAAAVEFPA